MKLFRAILLSCLVAVAIASPTLKSHAATTVLMNSEHRKTLDLDGDWHYLVDPYDGGLYNFHRELRTDGFFLNGVAETGSKGLVEYDFSKMPMLKVPGDWNMQADRLFYYEGMIWYQRDFDYQPVRGHKTFLHIGAANYRATAWVNGQQVCSHEGGYTAFDCDASTALVAGKNFVVIAVDNTRLADGVPTLNTDWWNYGGLTRDVYLVDVPSSFIDSYDLHLSRDRKYLEGSVQVQGANAGQEVTVELPELHRQVQSLVAPEGRASIHLSAEGVQWWAPESPKLYRVVFRSGEDRLEDEIGFRTIEVRGTSILLNGKPIFLRGISIHAEAPYRGGRAHTDADVATLLGWAKDLGCNYVRLAHYPHDQRMTRAADRMGLLVWSEIPVYWAEHFEDPAVLVKAKQQLHEEIARDRNRASIALWSIANETPDTPARTAFLKAMAAEVRSLDSTRLVTAALLVRTVGHDKYVDDELGNALDVIGANEYIGWYEQTPADADVTTWHIAFQKPFIISEFGADAKAGHHGSPEERWTEEYQASLFQHQLGMLRRMSQLRGMTPWVLMDFRSPMRQLPGIQDGFNRKGLVSDQGQKKQAFFVLQQAYRDPSFGKSE